MGHAISCVPVRAELARLLLDVYNYLWGAINVYAVGEFRDAVIGLQGRGWHQVVLPATRRGNGAPHPSRALGVESVCHQCLRNALDAHDHAPGLFFTLTIIIIFGSWKSDFYLVTLPTKTTAPTLCHLYGQLLLIILTYTLCSALRTALWTRQQRKRSYSL